ncbi:MAG: hypothetical protein K0S04_1318 [Herbinix sp.]|jgi:predicted dehydrogenase|nr:hypothetical protein [Herbinix sp.]
MKICFIGLGSIGMRHMRNLSRLLKEQGITYSIDALRSSHKALEGEAQALICSEYYSYEELPNGYDIIFITNPTYLHYDAIDKVRGKTKHLFIEKPVFESCAYDIEQWKCEQKGIYYVACPLRYSPVINYLKSEINAEKVYSVRVISSSYLPEWRKGVDYRKIYSSKKELGGGVTLDLIHEWDYITYLFGMPMQVYNISGKYSDLEISSDDVSIYIAKYEDKVIELHLDYFGRVPIRKVELFCKDCVIDADLLGSTIQYKGCLQKTVQFAKEDMYLNEMNYFLSMVLCGAKNENDIGHAYKVLGIATGKFEQK